MDKLDRKKISLLIHKLGLKYKLSDNIVKELVESPYEFASIIMKQLNIDDISDEDIKDLKTNFNFLALGKLYMEESLIKRRIKQKENINKVNKERWNK